MEEIKLEHELANLKNPSRIINLTDGVFAIIMTLLVLELKVPQVSSQELSHSLLQLGYKLMLYAISFLLAGVYWAGHKLIFSHVKYVNNTLIWLNIIFLMICSLIPFGAALLGTYPHEPASLIAYGVLLTMLASFRLFMYYYVSKTHKLLFQIIPTQQKKNVLSIMIFAPSMFLMSICLATNYPTIALIIYAITPPIFTALITIANHPKNKTSH